MPTIKIPLHSRKYPDLFALVDQDDAGLVNRYWWYPNVTFGGLIHARAHQVGGTTVFMHRLILNVSNGQFVDHANRNGLDNRRENLRLATTSQNSANRTSFAGTSGFKGVCWDKKDRRWKARIRVHPHRIHLGEFISEIDAAHAYDAAAREHFGEFARLNFPHPGERSAVTGEIEHTAAAWTVQAGEGESS